MTQPASFRDEVHHSRLFYRREVALTLATAAIRAFGSVDVEKVVTYADALATQLANLEEAELATQEEIPT